MTVRPGETLLVNFWYAHPVGHAIEALRYCLGYKRANPGMQVSLALNYATPYELGRLCPFIEATYPIRRRFPDHRADPLRAPPRIPRDWDWVVDDARRWQPDQVAAFPGLTRYYASSDSYFRARRGRGTVGARPPAYSAHQQLTLDLPQEYRDRARRRLEGSGVRIAVMPAGSGPRHWYPSATSWELILHALLDQHRDALVCFVGKHARDERTATSFGRDELDRLRRACPARADCFDDDLITQLAVVEACDLFVSPHTGFGMAALAVGTPWLALSGNSWPEYFFNNVPFYSVLPDPDRFPCHNGFGPEPPAMEQDSDGEGLRSPSMSAGRVEAGLDELLQAASALLERRLPYEAALEDHFRRMLQFYRGDRSRIWSIDGIHRRYL
jgi:hypothetical protein